MCKSRGSWWQCGLRFETDLCIRALDTSDKYNRCSKGSNQTNKCTTVWHLVYRIVLTQKNKQIKNTQIIVTITYFNSVTFFFFWFYITTQSCKRYFLKAFRYRYLPALKPLRVFRSAHSATDTIYSMANLNNYKFIICLN